MDQSSNYHSKGRTHGYTEHSSSSAAADMSRSDSGYYSSNAMNHHAGYIDHGDQIFAGPEGTYLQGHSGANSWTTQHADQQDFYLNAMPHSDQQFSDYITGHAGGQMAGQYPDRSIPRTAGNFMVDGSSEMDVDLDQLMAMPDHSQPGFEDDETMTTAVWAHRSVPDYVPDDYSQVNFEFDMASAPSEVEDHSSFHQYDAGFDLEPTSAHPSFGLSASEPSALQRQQPRQPPSQPDLASQQLSVTTTSTTTHPRFLCLQPDCGKQFNRAADLDRHQKNVHCKDMNKAMHCDYRKCPRHHNAFHRFDHFRDHLRDQHREDLLKRGAGSEVDATWWKTRLPGAVYEGWWRCGKCFLRVSVEEHEWRCPDCGNCCEQERQAMRKLPLKCDYVGCGAGRPDGEAFKSPARFREHLRTAHAEDVPRDKNKAGLAELQSAQWWASRYVFSASWRCTSCLDWVDHGRFGWECARCGFECEERRRVQRAGACGA